MDEHETRKRCAEIARSFPNILTVSQGHWRHVTGEVIARAIEANELYVGVDNTQGVVVR